MEVIDLSDTDEPPTRQTSAPQQAQQPQAVVDLCDDEDAGVQHAGRWLLPSEPFPFATKHLEALENAHPDRQFMLVDGEAFSWYGTRMWHAAAHFEEVRRWMAAS